ncbi:MAG: glutathione binding-like protein, partial [Sphingopyxis sp.]
LYIAEASGQLLPSDRKARWAALQWLQFHAASTGPILGQRVHFEMFAEDRIPGAIARYRELSHAAFTVLDARLGDHVFLAGEEYSIADIATFGWTHIARICGFSFGNFVHLSRWHEAVASRPAVQRGISLPAPATGP